MNHSPYLDQPFVPLAVALRSMLAETEAKIATAVPTETPRLQERAELLRGGFEVLRIVNNSSRQASGPPRS